MAREKPKISGDSSPLTSNPFAALRDKLGVPASEPTAAPAAPEPAPPEKRGPARAVVRIERKGRGGKEATVVEKLELPPKELEVWLKDLKKSLGTGGVIEGDTLVLQGDQRERLRELLEARGVRKVTVS